MDELLLACGIQTVVVSTEDGYSKTVTPVEENQLWMTSAMPWNYTGVRRDTEILARTSGANLTFTISFKDLWDTFEEEAFLETLENWESLLPEDEILQEMVEATPTPAVQDPSLIETPEDQLAKPLLKAMNYETAWSIHRDAQLKNADLQRELEARQEDLNAQIAVLDGQIRAIYDQWNHNG
jgi:hypothetical protein